MPFLLFVMLPTLLAGIYYFGIAAPQYVSEAHFVVRGQGSQPSGMLSSLLLSGGGGSASEDTYAVEDYVMSRDAAQEMLRTQSLKTVFDRPEGDRLARFPNPFGRNTFEHFFHYYQNHVTAELDSTTSISTLTVRTFRAADSQRIAVALLASGERLVNRMNARQRENMISSAAREVDEAEDRLRGVAAQMADYRNREALLDPLKQSVPMMKDISDLQTMLTTTQVQIAQLRTSAPNSPLIPVYERRTAALKQQIVQSARGITGSDQSLVPKITVYDDLTIQRDLAEKQLTAAAAALGTAKAQADRQALWLEQITAPNLADYPVYPRSAVSVLVVFASLLGLYLIARLVISGAREHKIV